MCGKLHCLRIFACLNSMYACSDSRTKSKAIFFQNPDRQNIDPCHACYAMSHHELGKRYPQPFLINCGTSDLRQQLLCVCICGSFAYFIPAKVACICSSVPVYQSTKMLRIILLQLLSVHVSVPISTSRHVSSLSLAHLSAKVVRYASKTLYPCGSTLAVASA